MLRRARTSSGQSYEQIAGKLHLSTRQITALEHDDYSTLPGPTYVRGYLRSYAEALGLEPQTVLAAHKLLTPAVSTPDFQAIAPDREMTSGHHHIQTVTWGVIAVILGLTLAWWLGGDTGIPAIAPTATPAPASLPDAGLAGNPSVTLPAEPPVPTPGSEPPVDVSSSIIPPVPVAGSGIAIAPITPEPAIGTTPTTPIATVTGLVVRTTQESWLDIRDAKNTKLLYDMVPAGRTIRVEGPTPIEVFVGNANGVQVEWNGEPVDVVRYQRGRIARFTVGRR
jgi:cytoskeleton protein RodZ